MDSFERYLEDYAVWHEVSGHSAKTITWYQGMLGTFHRWLLAHDRPVQVTKITIADVRAFLHSEQARTEKHVDHPFNITRAGKLSDRTIHGYARAIRAFWHWLLDEGYIATNPMVKLKPPKLEQRFKEVLSVPEMERLFAEINPQSFLGSRVYAMLALLYDTGIRIGELSGLDLADVDWGEQQLRVFGKGKEERFVPFSAVTHRILRKYTEYRETWAPKDQEALFITSEGRRLDRHAASAVIKRLGQRAGIPRLHAHLLRHSAAVAALMNGADQFALKRILGHKQLSTTDGYVDYAREHLAEQHRRFSPMARVNERRVRMRPPAGKRRRA